MEGLSLAALARALTITPASLVSANQDRAGLLAPGFVFTAQGVEVAVPLHGQPGADASLDEIALAFRNQGVPFDSLMAALANDETPGLFRGAVRLEVDRRIIAAGWTLASNDTGIAAATLALLNLDTLDLFAAGTPIFRGTRAVAGLDSATLEAIARAYAIEPGELLEFNAGLAPKAAAPDDGAGLPIPGLARLPNVPAMLRIPYRIRAAQSLAEIAVLFRSASIDPCVPAELALLLANQDRPGTVAPGQTLCIDGQTLVTQAGDSFAALIARCAPAVSLAALAAAIAERPDVLASGALLLCPPAKLSSSNPGISPATLGSLYGQEATQILSANAATAGLIRPGIRLEPSPLASQPSVTTLAADSLNAIIRRFALAGIALTLADLVQANSDIAFLAPGAELLLPPADTLLQAAFGDSGWQFPEVLFPLHTWLTLRRDSALVEPASRGSATAPSPVEQACSPIAACACQGSLERFATTLEELIPGLKLAASEDSAQPRTWALSFVAPDGIGAVTVGPTASVPGVEGPQPLTFALRPLSNSLSAASGVALKTLDPLSGGWGATQDKDYQGIELDAWALAWLADLDRLCGAAYATPAALVAADPFERLLAAKQLLASALADGIAPVLVDHAQANAIQSVTWTAAREALHPRLLDQLACGYSSTAVIQFNATLSAPAAAATARLRGVGRLRTLSTCGQALAADALKSLRLGHASIALGPTTSGTLSLPLEVAQPARQSALSFEPEYEVNALEFDGQDHAVQALSFIRAFDRFPPAAYSVALGSPRVPLPLRAYPQSPVLIGQSAEMPVDPQSVDAALHWNYLFSYSQQSAAQDQTLLEVEFNSGPPRVSAVAEDGSLFRALAQYVESRDSLWQILAELQGVDAHAANTRLVSALDTYAELAERIAGLWSSWWAQDSRADEVAGLEPSRTGTEQPGLPSAGVTAERYQYRATLGTAWLDGVEVYDSLTLERLQADGAIGWPGIDVSGSDGMPVSLSAEGTTGDIQVYRFPTADAASRVPAFSRLVFHYRLGPLLIARYQSANAALSLCRNAHLLGPAGPQTCAPFVYQTPPLRFPEPLVPLISVDSLLAIGTWTQSAASNPLTLLFEQLFDNDQEGRQIAVNISYGYPLESSTPPIDTLLPVLRLLPFTYDPASSVQQIIDALATWVAQMSPVDTGAFWRSSITLYSSAAPDSELPLLQLGCLDSPIP